MCIDILAFTRKNINRASIYIAPPCLPISGDNGAYVLACIHTPSCTLCTPAVVYTHMHTACMQDCTPGVGVHAALHAQAAGQERKCGER